MHKFTAILILLISACGIIRINENGYHDLTISEKKFIIPFNEKMKTDNIGTKLIYEINTFDIKLMLKKNKFTWVHLWRPYCSSDYCQNINYFSDLEDKFINKDFHLLLISETYDISLINEIVKETEFKKTIYVLQDTYYGHKIKKNRKKFVKEIYNNHLILPKLGFDNYVFKDTVLIFSSNEVNKEIIDSLIIDQKR